MSDIVERLLSPISPMQLDREAAAEITSLRARVRELEKALEAWRDAARFNITMEGAQYTGVEHSRALKAWEKTRAALNTQEQT